MTGVTATGTFLVMWIGFLALMIVGLALILLWAVRAGQFSNQDRARYLPLTSGIPRADREEHHENPSRKGMKKEGAPR